MYRGRMFERLVFDIFASAGWHMEAEAAEMNRNCGWDGFARRGNDYCFIEVRTYRRKFMEIGVFKQMVLRTSLIKDIHQKGLKVIVFGKMCIRDRFWPGGTAMTFIWLERLRHSRLRICL